MKALTMTNLRSLIGAFLFAPIAWQFGSATAQIYPDKPVRLVTAAAGAGGDFVARIVEGFELGYRPQLVRQLHDANHVENQ